MSYRYIGNKTRLAGYLTELVRERTPTGGRIADLMCGTGSFAVAMREAGFHVYASDIMTFAYLHARVRLNFRAAPRFSRLAGSYEEVLQTLNSLPPSRGLFFREYGPEGRPTNGSPPRQYFSARNAARIDSVNAQIGAWRLEGLLTEDEHDLLRHDLVLAANRVANIAGTYGHFWSQWANGALDDIELRPSGFVDGPRTDHVVRRGRAEDLSEGIVADLCYLDPPYTKRQYAANYHIPETLARGDEPPANGLSGLRPWRDQYSDFCSKLRLREAFTQVITRMECRRFLISYSEDGLLEHAEMAEFLGRFGKVRSHAITLQRFRSNQSPLGRDLTEYVFDLERR
jgi:adenine-specific DNA-methyltransferase